MPISEKIKSQAVRLNATFVNQTSKSAVDFLLNSVHWPRSVFTGSVARMREIIAANGEGARFSSEQSYRDYMGMLYQFRFLETPGSFWENWQEQFPLVDSTEFFPFAADDYYFYFLRENRSDKFDPLVYKVDHEETNLEPLALRYPASILLGVLEPCVDEAQ